MKKLKKAKKIELIRVTSSPRIDIWNEEYHVKNFSDLLKRSGGSATIAHKLKLHAFTVENWRRCGVPLKYWEFFIKEHGILPRELLDIWKDCKKSK